VQATFGSDDHVVRIRRQRLADQPFADERPVCVRGVDERDPQLDSPKQHPPRLANVARLAHDPGPGYSHRPVAETVDGDRTAE
jgi:hypothetical protein